MANKKITALPAGSGILDRVTKLLAMVIGGVTSKVSLEQITGEYVEEGTIASTDILACGGVPYNVIPTPGAGYYLRVLRADFQLVYATTPYAVVQNLILKNTTASKGQFAFAKILINTVSAICPGILQDVVVAADSIFIEDEPLAITTSTGVDPTLGDSDVKYRIRYAIEPIM